MNRRTLEKHLRHHGCVFDHHGKKHDFWVNPTNSAIVPVPRHTDVKNGTVRNICRTLRIPLPPEV
jgi:predicted RNA binding protein YcfA (HicA-like mRNA interferase family)